MAPITALEAIEMLRILGLSVRLDGAKLFVSPAELIDEEVAWLVRKYKTEIIAELQTEKHDHDLALWAWQVAFSGYALEVYCHPVATAEEVKRKYPAAILIKPLPESMHPHDPSRKENEA
jgi:hypothetical protein